MGTALFSIILTCTVMTYPVDLCWESHTREQEALQDLTLVQCERLTRSIHDIAMNSKPTNKTKLRTLNVWCQRERDGLSYQIIYDILHSTTKLEYMPWTAR